MLIASGRRGEAAVFPGLVAAQEQQVADAEKLEVEQFVLDVLDGGAAAYHVGHDGDVVFVLYRSGNGYGARTAAHAGALEQSVVELLIYNLAVVRGYVDKPRVKCLQLIYCVEQPLRACALQGRQHLKREVPAVFVRINQFRYCHLPYVYIPLQIY